MGGSPCLSLGRVRLIVTRARSDSVPQSVRSRNDDALTCVRAPPAWLVSVFAHGYHPTMLTENLLEDARSIAERITALRRAIHAEPELGLETPKTLAKVRAELADLPLEWREGPSCTGAVAVLNGGKPGRSGAPARRHGRAADARRDGPAVRLDHPRPNARLRARHAHGDACGRRPDPCRSRRGAAGRGALHVPAGGRGVSRRALHDRRWAARSAARCRFRAPHHAQRSSRGDRQPARARCLRPPTCSRSSSKGAAATRRCRTTRATLCQWRARS